MKTIILTGICGLIFFFNNCTLFKKNISKPVVISMPDRSVKVEVNSTAINTKYSTISLEDELIKRFLTGFENEAKATKFVSLKEDASDSDFIIKIKKLSIEESSNTEKISDEKSPYNGQEVVLNSINCSVEVEIIDAKNKANSIKNCFNSKIRSEKLKNNRDAADLVTGANKDRTSYRTKLLSDSICVDLAEDVGRRIWVPITRRIAKAIK